MTETETAKIIFSKKIICQLFGHKMITSKNITEYIRGLKLNKLNFK
jgi:hypothetical protein